MVSSAFFTERLETRPIRVSERYLGYQSILVDNISLSYGLETVLDDVTIQVSQGDKVAIIGPNGVGKSTLLRIIAGIDSPDMGSVKIASDETIGYVPQSMADANIEPETIVLDFMKSAKNISAIESRLIELTDLMALPSFNPLILLEYGELTEEFEKIGGYTVDSDIKYILDGLGVSGIEGKRFCELSGGQKTKVLLARAIYSHPSILLLDEPTNHIDSNSKDWLEGFLRTYDGTVIVISHDDDFLESIIDTVVSLDISTRSATTEKCSLSTFRKNMITKDDLNLRAAIKAKKVVEREWEIVRRLAGGKRTKNSQGRAKQLLRSDTPEIPVTSNRSASIHFEVDEEGGREVLEIHNLGIVFPSLVFEYPNISLKRGEIVSVTGPIGTGKSTLLKLISSRLSPDQGNIRLGIGVTVGYYAQEHEELRSTNNLLEELRNTSGLSDRVVRDILGHFLFSGDTVFKKVSFLSEGEKSRLVLAKLVAQKNNFLVLDETTNHLDVDSRQRLIEALGGFTGTMLIVSHDKDFLAQIKPAKNISLPTGVITLN